MMLSAGRAAAADDSPNPPTNDIDTLGPGPEPSAVIPSEKVMGHSSTLRVGKDWYLAARLPAVTIVGSATAGEIGVEGGLYLGPQVLLLAEAQTGFVGHSEDTSGQMGHAGVAGRLFLGNVFFLGGGLNVRRISLNLKAAHEQTPGESASNLERPYQTFGQAQATTLGIPLALGWQWQAHNFAIGLEAVSVFIPVSTVHTHGSFDAAYTYSDHDHGEPGRKARSLTRTADLSLGRLMIGASF